VVLEKSAGKTKTKTKVTVLATDETPSYGMHSGFDWHQE